MPSRLLRGVGLFWPYGWSPHAVSSGPQAAYRSLMQGDAAGIPLGAASPPKELHRTALHAMRSAFGAGSLRSMVSGRPAAASGRSARAVRCPSKSAPSTVPQISSPLRPTLNRDRAKALWFSAGGIHKAAPYKASPLRKPIPVPLMARRRTQGNGASNGRLHGQQTTVVRLGI